MSLVQEKTFEWTWGRKRELIFAHYYTSSCVLELWHQTGLFVKDTPADIFAIWDSLFSSFLVEGRPANDFWWNILQNRQDYGVYEYGIKTERTSSGTAVSIFADFDTQKNEYLGTAHFIHNGKTLEMGATHPISRPASLHGLAWAMLYKYALENRFDPSEIAYKFPLGEVNIQLVQDSILPKHSRIERAKELQK